VPESVARAATSVDADQSCLRKKTKKLSGCGIAATASVFVGCDHDKAEARKRHRSINTSLSRQQSTDEVIEHIRLAPRPVQREEISFVGADLISRNAFEYLTDLF
jgi:hypothetical protein